MPKSQPTTCPDTKICAACGNEFSRNGRPCSYFNDRVVCSQACRAELVWRSRPRGHLVGTDPKTCEHCGEPFSRRPDEGASAFAKRRSCGYACSNVRTNQERQQYLYGDINKPRFCGYCGDRLVRKDSESNAKYFERQTCDSTCGAKFMGVNKRRPEELRVTKYSTEFMLIRAAIRERDGNMCRLCGALPGKIAHSVHHIDYDKTSADERNLITLCQPCHVRTNYDRDYWQPLFERMMEQES